jgi:hypothetical protein
MSNDEAFWKAIADVDEAVSIYDGPVQFQREFAAVPAKAGNLFASHWCQTEVCNGGFRQFYTNSTGVLAPEAVEAFKELGMPGTAAVVAEANSWFGYAYPRQRQTRELTLKAHATMHPGSSGPFEELEEKFFRLLSSENGGFERAVKAYLAGQDGA